MEPFRYHVFICDQKKPEGVPCCPARGLGGNHRGAAQGSGGARPRWTKFRSRPAARWGFASAAPTWWSTPKASGTQECGRKTFPNSSIRILCEGRVVERLVNRDVAGLRAEIQSNRAKFMAAQRAKDAAGVLPDDLNQTLRAYMESRALLTALELDVFTAVGSGATAAEVAQKISTHPRATEMLLNALAAMGMLAKQQGVFRDTPATARYFAEGSKDNARPGLIHIANIWHRWSNLTECVRAGTAVGHQEMAERGDDWTEPFIAAMHRNAAERAPLVVQAVGAAAGERLLDVGGGSAAYSIAFAQANEKLHATVLDLPAVLPIAQRHINAAGLAGRVETRAGDLRRDPLGKGFTLVLVSAICHMLSPGRESGFVPALF